ncbi:MAG: hypothetical protein J7M21_05615, partial [Planctomycetes bacterium]|nr:hypothetical protein [Planctomycetota bacterium]
MRAVVAGRKFRLGVLLEMQPGWHVYWKNPGDAGLATSVSFQLPAGFSAGPLRWPVPEIYTEPGGIIAYGYSGSVFLTAEVAAPRNLRPGRSVECRADVAYLACKELCAPGRSSLRLVLPVAAKTAADHAALFERWSARLAVPADKAGDLRAVSISGRLPDDGSAGTFSVLLDWKKPPGEVSCAPAPARRLAVKVIRVRRPIVRTAGASMLNCLPAAGAQETSPGGFFQSS